MTHDQSGPPAFDTSVANQARIYDYLLGGKDNYAADRAAVEQQLAISPDVAFRSPRPSRRRPGSCTWTSTRWCSPTPARC